MHGATNEHLNNRRCRELKFPNGGADAENWLIKFPKEGAVAPWTVVNAENYVYTMLKEGMQRISLYNFKRGAVAPTAPPYLRPWNQDNDWVWIKLTSKI